MGTSSWHWELRTVFGANPDGWDGRGGGGGMEGQKGGGYMYSLEAIIFIILVKMKS